MNNTITLKNPLKINGTYVKTLIYDTEKITGELYCVAEARKAAALNASGVGVSETMDPSLMVAEVNNPLHLFLGYAAVIAINPDIDWSDLERVTGSDINEFRKIGRFFITGSEDSAPAISGEGSETTRAPSTSTDISSNNPHS